MYKQYIARYRQNKQIKNKNVLTYFISSLNIFLFSSKNPENTERIHNVEIKNHNKKKFNYNHIKLKSKFSKIS
jgi:hypothetical protein